MEVESTDAAHGRAPSLNANRAGGAWMPPTRRSERAATSQALRALLALLLGLLAACSNGVTVHHNPGSADSTSAADTAAFADFCLPPPGPVTATTQTWPSDPLPPWTIQAVKPDTLCTVAPGAWNASSPVGEFVGVGAGSGGTVVVLHGRGLLRVDATGKLVQSVNLEAKSARLEQFCPAPQGGWFLLGANAVYEPLVNQALFSVSDAGAVNWTLPGVQGRRLDACAAMADGGVVVGGAEPTGQGDGTRAFWQYVSASGVAAPAVLWPLAGEVSALIQRPNGTLCAGSGYDSAEADRQVQVGCWQGTVPLWTRTVEEPGLDDRIQLATWPDGSLLATVSSLRYGPFTQTVVAIDPSGAATETWVARTTSGLSGNQGWKAGSDDLNPVVTLPCASVGDVRTEVASEAKGSGESMVWERRTPTHVQPLVRFYARGGARKPSATAGLLGNFAFSSAVVQQPDGSLWFVGRHGCTETGGSLCGWVYRLPALTACPAGSALPP